MSVIFSVMSVDCSAGNPDRSWTWFCSEKTTLPLAVLHWGATVWLVFLADDLNTSSYILMGDVYFGVVIYFLQLPGCFRHPPTAALTPDDSSFGVGRQQVVKSGYALELRHAEDLFLVFLL